MHELNDTTLVQKIRDGSEKAFRELYDRYHVQMFFIAKKYIKELCLAEDEDLTHVHKLGKTMFK